MPLQLLLLHFDAALALQVVLVLETLDLLRRGSLQVVQLHVEAAGKPPEVGDQAAQLAQLGHLAHFELFAQTGDVLGEVEKRVGGGLRLSVRIAVVGVKFLALFGALRKVPAFADVALGRVLLGAPRVGELPTRAPLRGAGLLLESLLRVNLVLELRGLRGDLLVLIDECLNLSLIFFAVLVEFLAQGLDLLVCLLEALLERRNHVVLPF